MRILPAVAIVSLSVVSALCGLAQGVSAAELSRGQQLAIQADCAGCHLNPDGSSEYSGGLPMATPVGTIYARNITPDTETGIGGWSLEDFDHAVRDGKSKDIGSLYPAMPYPYYHAMTDDDVAALYQYFMHEVQPVRHDVSKTDLGFPFVRPAMLAWNLLFAGNSRPQTLQNATAQVSHGQYLVDVLGHCGDCHTPRGMFGQTLVDQHLSGAMIGGWHAPNISSDATGIGEWTDRDLQEFLTTGHTTFANAGGDMGAVLQLSLSKLPESDIDAIVAYLRATVPLQSPALTPVRQAVPAVDITAVEPVNETYADVMDGSSTDGALLYQSVCASCHGVNGSVDNDARPSLVKSRTVRSANPNNLIQAIYTGIDMGALDTQALMPSFKDELTAAQIAAIASYVRKQFAGLDTALTAADVQNITSGMQGVPWLLQNARWLAWLGVAVVGLLLFRLLLRRKR